MLKIYSQSLGCPKNRVDTERLLGSLGPDIQTVEEPEEADLVFINTCSFISPAVEESVHAVVQMVEDLDGLPSRPLLAVGGCLVGRYGAEELAREIPEVNLWLHTAEIENWPDQLARALSLAASATDLADGAAYGSAGDSADSLADELAGEVTEVLAESRPKGRPEGRPEGRLLSTGPSYAWLKIGEGCRHRCSFCTIPSIRGEYRSAPADALERETRALLDQGVREIVLVAQDVTAWGSDLDGKKDLRPLLERLLPLPGLARLRLMYLYPAGLTDELLSFLKQAGEPFVPYFDVPLQHAHPDVLGRMGRPFARNPQEVVDRIRTHFPDAALRTTMMTGFPGETDEHFQTLMDFVAKNRFHHMGVFAWQAEEGTAAASMDGQVPERLREARRDELMALQNGISEDILLNYEGERLPVLVDAPHGEWPGLFVGRTWFQAPEVDGITYVSGPGVASGALTDAEIVETREYDLVALA